MFDIGTGAECLLAENGLVHGNDTPTEEDKLVLGQGDFRDVAAPGLGVGIVRKEDHAHAEVVVLEQLVAQLFHFEAEELVGNLGEHTRSVARLGIGVHCATVDEGANAG